MIDHLKRIIACGCFRSGTTILAKILSAHDQILFTSELYAFLPDWEKHFKKKIQNLKAVWPNVDNIDSIYSNAFDSAERYKKFLDAVRLEQMAPKEILELYWSFSKCKEQKKYYGDKWPEYVFRLKEILRPGAKVIFCIRDPRDVIESQIRSYWKGIFEGLSPEETKRLHHWRVPSISKCINKKYNWLDYMQAWDNAKKNLNFDWFELHYSNLVDNLESTAERLGVFLGVDTNIMLKNFKQYFSPIRHQNWKKHFPELTERLPESWKEMMLKYKIVI